MTPVVATSNVEAVMLGVVGGLAASLLYLLVFRWSTRPKIEVTATAGEDHIEVVIANNSRRAMFDVHVRATAGSSTVQWGPRTRTRGRSRFQKPRSLCRSLLDAHRTS
jgi:hypothetical protein